MPDQSLVDQAFAIARSRGASAKVLLALAETGFVESDWQNLNYGDKDSVGYLQQRPSQGWANPMDITTSTNAFLDQAIANDTANPNYTAGQLAQSVQRSAVPDAYDQTETDAVALLKGVDPTVSPPLAGAGGTEDVGLGLGDIPGIGPFLAAGVKAFNEFVAKAKLGETILTSITKIFLPNNLLRGAAGALGVIMLCFSLWFLGRELTA